MPMVSLYSHNLEQAIREDRAARNESTHALETLRRGDELLISRAVRRGDDGELDELGVQSQDSERLCCGGEGRQGGEGDQPQHIRF